MSSHVSLVLSHVRALANPGMKVRRKLVRGIGELALIGPDTQSHVELWSVTHWIGTSGPRCMLRLAIGPAVVERIVTVAASVFWSHRHWEDLAFYRDQRVVYHCLTHEHEGAVYGGAEDLMALGLTPLPSADHWTVQGERFDSEYSRALVSELISGGPATSS
jgi:hypothetical protein